jgi:hypothetical protein
MCFVDVYNKKPQQAQFYEIYILIIMTHFEHSKYAAWLPGVLT